MVQGGEVRRNNVSDGIRTQVGGQIPGVSSYLIQFWSSLAASIGEAVQSRDQVQVNLAAGAVWTCLPLKTEWEELFLMGGHPCLDFRGGVRGTVGKYWKLIK